MLPVSQKSDWRILALPVLGLMISPFLEVFNLLEER